jgi:ribonuclease-3
VADFAPSESKIRHMTPFRKVDPGERWIKFLGVPTALNTPLDALQQRIGCLFQDPKLLERSVTHTSFLQDHAEAGESNQRLEFLGDAVLQLILTEALFHLFPGEREGVLSKRRAALTKGSFLAQLAREIGLDACLRLGAGEEGSGGRSKASVLEDAFEALVGAVHLDLGLAATRAAVLAIYGDLGLRLASTEEGENPKGRLQELVQPTHGNQALRYEVVRVEGADHARAYEVAVYLRERSIGQGRGTSKKLAEEAAARAALEHWGEV